MQEDHYYPFGLTLGGLGKQGSNPWTFQGQEKQDELNLNWMQFKWRNHDPSIGRFFNVDPLAEDYYYNSPYAFSENKVVAHVELEGLEARSANRFRKGSINISRGISNKVAERTNIRREMQLNSTDGRVVSRAESDRRHNSSQSSNQITTGVEDATKGGVSFTGEVLETGGDIVSNGALAAASVTGGATLPVAGVAEVVSRVGAGMQVVVDISDGNTESAIENGVSLVIDKTGGDLIKKAVKQTKITTPNMTDKQSKTQETVLQSLWKGIMELTDAVIDAFVDEDE